MYTREQNFSVFAYNHANLCIEVLDIETLEGVTILWRAADYNGNHSQILISKSSENGDIEINDTDFIVRLYPSDFDTIMRSPNHFDGKEYIHETKIIDYENKEFTVAPGKMKVYNSLFRS